MTKNEFKLRALLAMCSNPKYVDGIDLQVESMIEDANELANHVVKSLYFPFEDDCNAPIDSTKKLLYDTCSAIEEISMPDGKLDFMNDTLKGIEKSLDYLNELIGQAIADDEETECDA